MQVQTKLRPKMRGLTVRNAKSKNRQHQHTTFGFPALNEFRCVNETLLRHIPPWPVYIRRSRSVDYSRNYLPNEVWGNACIANGGKASGETKRERTRLGDGARETRSQCGISGVTHLAINGRGDGWICVSRAREPGEAPRPKNPTHHENRVMDVEHAQHPFVFFLRLHLIRSSPDVWALTNHTLPSDFPPHESRAGHFSSNPTQFVATRSSPRLPSFVYFFLNR